MSDRGDIARGYQRTAAEDREVTEFLRDFDHAIVRLNALGVDVLRLRGFVCQHLEALESLRAAWNEHMKTCPQHAKLPSFDEIKAWMDAPSNTAGGG